MTVTTDAPVRSAVRRAAGSLAVVSGDMHAPEGGHYFELGTIVRIDRDDVDLDGTYSTTLVGTGHHEDFDTRDLRDFFVYLTGFEGDLDGAASCLRMRGARVYAATGVDDLEGVHLNDVVALLPGQEQDRRVDAVRVLAEAAGVPVVRFEDLLVI